MNTLFSAVSKSVSTLVMFAFILGSFGLSFGAIGVAHAAELPTVKVTIDKFVDGTMATAGNANSLPFPMSATWNATNIGAGTGGYDLGPSNAVAYEAVTADMTSGADYSTNEVTDGANVAASCDAGAPFALVGYTTGDTFAEAAAATPSLTIPAFVGLTSDKFVIVWNHDCSLPTTVKVTIDKFINGAQATDSSASSQAFPMSATWNDPTGFGSGTGSYTLDSTSDPVYEAQTVAFNSSADYSTNEVTDGAIVGASCASGDTPFALEGYSTGNTSEEAAAAEVTATVPAFTNMTSDKFVIVHNVSCSNYTGTIGGDVTGGSNPEGSLAVTSVDATDTSATADGSFAHGWIYTFHITVPTNETNLAMKFADWVRNPTPGTIPVAGNMRISSLQANNGNATVLLTAANTYSTPPLTMTGDLDAGTPGMQVEVKVEVAVPVGTINGSYTTSYGVQTLP